MGIATRLIECQIAGVVLLLLFCLARPAYAQFEGNISRWTDQDALDTPPAGSILFTGSSGVRRWEQLALDFADYEVIQRGFGGSQFEDLTEVVDDIVLPYNPSAIVVWAGTNDIANGESGTEVFADYQQFVNLVRAAQPDVDIFYLGIMPTPGRQANQPDETVANSAIANQAASDPKLHYVDLPAAFATLNPYNNAAFTSQFVDSIHLNRRGYEFWTSIIRPSIEAVIAPNKIFAANPNTLQPGSRILFDFGPSNSQDGDHTLGADANNNYWNNWHQAVGGVAVTAGEHLGDLIDDQGTPTGIDLTITGGFSANGKLNGGLLSPSANLLGDFAVASATQDYFFSTADDQPEGGSDDNGGGFMLDGLDPNMIYDFRFFGSRNSFSTRITEYLVTGSNSAVATLRTSGWNIGSNGTYDGNDDEFAYVTGIRPDQYGQIFVDLTLVQGEFAYINAMEVTARSFQADFNEDGTVDGQDLGDWESEFGTLGTAAHSDGDTNGDRDVDGYDFLNWQRQLGSAPSISVTAIELPECSTGISAIVGVLTLSFTARTSHQAKHED
ncbi:MAG: GDSL-type esterase/lipase family protein [Planctomycetota bacterium]